MDSKDHLPIDLADPQDIRAKLPAARKLYEDKRRELERLRLEVEHWGTLVELLARLVGESPAISGSSGIRASAFRKETPAKRRKGSPAQDRAVQGLERARRPIGPAALYRFMEDEGLGVPTNPNALGAALWSAVKAGRAKKTPDGLYAPLDWEPAQVELGSSRNGSAASEEDREGQTSPNPSPSPEGHTEPPRAP
jgi:hypothetical protein